MSKISLSELAEELGEEIPEKLEAQEWKQDICEEIDYIIPFKGLARDIQGWILDSSMYPQPAIAFAASMTILGACIGRTIAFDNLKGNLMYICLAESGEGKDWPMKASRILMSEVGLSGAVASKMASGAALTEAMIDSPSLLLHIDEFGNYLSSISGKNANQYSKEIVGILTEVSTSGDSIWEGKKTKGNDAPTIEEPNLCLLGLSTERQIFDGVKTSDLADGSLARYSVIFGTNGQLPRKVNNDKRKPPKNLIDDLRDLVNHYNGGFKINISKQVLRDTLYDQHHFDLTTRIKKMSNAFLAHPEKNHHLTACKFQAI